jgi:hypothetical protein
VSSEPTFLKAYSGHISTELGCVVIICKDVERDFFASIDQPAEIGVMGLPQHVLWSINLSFESEHPDDFSGLASIADLSTLRTAEASFPTPNQLFDFVTVANAYSVIPTNNARGPTRNKTIQESLWSF